MSVKSEAEIKSNIIDILDPARLSTEYGSMSLDELKKVLENRTKMVKVITHESFQEIYDMPSPGNIDTNELVLLKQRILNQNSMIEELRNIVLEKERELTLIRMEIDNLNKTKSYKNEVYEAGSYAAYIAAKEAEENGEEPPIIIEPPKPKPYVDYTPNKRIFDTSIFNHVLSSNSYNGDISEQEAIKMAIKESEKEAVKSIDLPFQRATESEKEEDHFDIIDEKPIEMNVSKPANWDHLKSRPTSLTDEMLEELTALLINHEFDKVKAKLSNEYTPEVTRYIRELRYDGSSFKQMLVSKSIHIHKAITGEK